MDFIMKGKFVLIFALSAVVFCSCGAMQVYVNPDSSHSRQIPITINNKSDQSGALGELQFQLQSNGYKLMSLSAVKKSFTPNADVYSSFINSELTSARSVSSVYVLEMDYSYYWDVFYYAFTNFSATITDLESGELVMTVNFRGDKGVKAIIGELVEEMNKVFR